VVELPKPPWYRRFGVIFLAANLVVAAVLVAVVVALWPRAAQRPHAPATTAGVGHQAEQVVPQGPEPATILTTSTKVRLEAGVLWQKRGVPGRWADGSMRPGAGGWSGRSTARALPSTVGATSSCMGRCLRGGLGAALWGQGTRRRAGHRWRPRPPHHRVGV
jgi:hypothetical protein